MGAGRVRLNRATSKSRQRMLHFGHLVSVGIPVKTAPLPTENNGWMLIDWDGNRSLHYKCWRKKFGRGHVSVGVGEFTHVSFDYGANSDDSYGRSRWDDKGTLLLSEIEAMAAVDRGNGKVLVRETQPPNPVEESRAPRLRR